MPDLRKVKAIAWIDQKNVWIEGSFHGWFQNYEEFESGPGNYPVAIVEEPSGKIRLCHAESVTFLNPITAE